MVSLDIEFSSLIYIFIFYHFHLIYFRGIFHLPRESAYSNKYLSCTGTEHTTGLRFCNIVVLMWQVSHCFMDNRHIALPETF